MSTQKSSGYYAPSFFIFRYGSAPEAGEAFCKKCQALHSHHVQQDNADVLRCPINLTQSYERGGTVVYWLRSDRKSPHFSDDPKSVRPLVERSEISKVMLHTGERLTFVEAARPEITLTYDETRFLLGLINRQALNLDAIKPDPSIFDGMTSDELGTLLGKLQATP